MSHRKYLSKEYRTAVGLGDHERLTGEAAILNMKSNAKNTLWGFNRFLGMKYNNPALNEELKFVHAKCVPTENQGIGFEMRYRGETRIMTPEQLYALYLCKLKNIYESAKIVCGDIVIAVPPYFSAVERQALIDATKIAGINCCRIINETTAIGLSYGLFRHGDIGDKTRYVMFVDMGYSKLTVSVMEFKSTQYTILAQGWEPNLGARNMDADIIEKLASDFQKKYDLNLRKSPKAMIRMFDTVQRVRKILSANTEAPIIVESIMEDNDVNYNLTRKEFESIIEPYLERIRNMCIKILEESKVKPEDVHSIEMVGEATRIPSVIATVQSCLKAPITRTMNSADCVARGCAIQCAIFSPLFKVREFKIVDNNPFPVDVVYNLPKNEKGESVKKSRTLFAKGANFSNSKALSFDNRKEPLEIQLMYSQNFGQLPLGGPTLLGNYKINPGSPLEPKFTLTSKITLDLNMIPYVSSVETIEEYIEEKKVVVKKAPIPAVPKQEEKKDEKKDEKQEDKKDEKKEENKEEKNDEKKEEKKEEKMVDIPQPEQEYEIQKITKKRVTPIEFQYEVHGFSSKKIAEFAALEKEMQHEDHLIIMTKERKNALESYIYETRAKLNSEVRDYTDEKTANTILTALEAAENWLFGEGKDLPMDAYETRLEELKKRGDPIILRHRAFGTTADRSTMLENLIQKAIGFQKETMEKDTKYTQQDKDEIAKLIQELTSWLKNANQTLQSCPKTAEPAVKEKDFIDQIQKLETAISKLVNKPKPEEKKEEKKEEKNGSKANGTKADKKTEAKVEEKVEAKVEDQKPQGPGEGKMEDVANSKTGP